MSSKTFAILTDIHSNIFALEGALSIIKNRKDVDQLICIGDYFALGPDPVATIKALKSIPNCIFTKGNHERYLLEKIWNDEKPDLEGMHPDDPILAEIVQNEKWTANQIGSEGVEFCKSLDISYREIVGTTLVEFTHAWYERDEQPPTMEEAINWRNNLQDKYPEIKQFIFVHGHLHVPREESIENLTILCQGATGLPFDEDQRGAIGFLTVGDSFKWDVVRFEYNQKSTIDLLEKRQPPFYKNLQNTVRYATIKND